MQSITERSKWLQFVQLLEGFATCSGKVLTASLKYRSLLQRMHAMCVMWFCATGSILKGVFFMVYTMQAHLPLIVSISTVRLRKSCYSPWIKNESQALCQAFTSVGTNMYFSQLKWLLKCKITDAFYSLSLQHDEKHYQKTDNVEIVPDNSTI